MTAQAVAREPGLFWKWLPALLLGSGLCGLGFMLRLALDDPGFAVETDYYKKAVTWDSRLSEQAASRRLGWSARVSFVEQTAGDSALIVELRDADSAPLTGATLTAEAFANARALQRRIVTLHETTPGTYLAHVPQARRGLWEVRLRAERGSSVFGLVTRTELLARHVEAAP